MGYCFMTIAKVKNLGSLSKRAQHNLRQREVYNADPDKANQNEVLLGNQDDNVTQLWRDRFDKIEYYKSSKLRSNAVIGLEVVMTVPAEDKGKINLEKWKKDNLEWLKETFESNPNQKNSILNVVYHGDESNAHIHAIVMPLDEREHLNAKEIMSRRNLIEMQNSYGEKMKSHGLERGLKGSVAKHKDIRKMYAKLDNAISYSQAMQKQPHETIEEFQERIVEEAKTREAVHLNDIEKKNREIIELKTKLKQKSYEKASIENTLEAKKDAKIASKKVKKWDAIEHEFGNPDLVKEKIEKTEKLNHALKNYPDKQLVDDTLTNIQTLMKWQEEEAKKKEKEKTRQEKLKLAKEQMFGEK